MKRTLALVGRRPLAAMPNLIGVVFIRDRSLREAPPLHGGVHLAACHFARWPLPAAA